MPSSRYTRTLTLTSRPHPPNDIMEKYWRNLIGGALTNLPICQINFPAKFTGHTVFHCCCHSNINKRCVQYSMFLLLVYWQLLMLVWLQLEVSILWGKWQQLLIPVIIHSTRRPHRDHCYPGQPHPVHNTLLIGQYEATILTYLSVVKLWFTLRASASAAAPESLILFPPRLWKTELVQVVKLN